MLEFSSTVLPAPSPHPKQLNITGTYTTNEYNIGHRNQHTA